MECSVEHDWAGVKNRFVESNWMSETTGGAQ